MGRFQEYRFCNVLVDRGVSDSFFDLSLRESVVRSLVEYEIHDLVLRGVVEGGDVSQEG